MFRALLLRPQRVPRVRYQANKGLGNRAKNISPHQVRVSLFDSRLRILEFMDP